MVYQIPAKAQGNASGLFCPGGGVLFGGGFHGTRRIDMLCGRD
jgi:hypothetical protein